MLEKETLGLIMSGVKELKKNIFLFRRAILRFIFLYIFYSLSVYWKQQNNLVFYNSISIVIVIVYFLFAHNFVEHSIIELWGYVGLPRIPNKLTATLGFIDRTVYALCFVIQQYTLIGVWLGIKVASRLVEFKGVELTGDDKKDEAKIRPLGERKNIFIIGNLISLLMGIWGGYLIIILFNLPQPRFFKF